MFVDLSRAYSKNGGKQITLSMLELVLNCLGENERENAELCALLFAVRGLLHGPTANRASEGWYLWRQHYQEKKEEGSILFLVSGPLAGVYQKVREFVVEQFMREQRQGMSDARLKEREEQSRQLKQRAEKLRALRRTVNVPGYAQAALKVKVSKWDSHPWLLGTRQGVIDLRTGTLRPGQPEDHLRTMIPTEWKGLDEPAPRFQQFLHEIFGDRKETEREELIAFLQRALGYGITGHVSERVFLMLYGEGEHNGKDILMHVLEYVLGKAIGAVPSGILIPGGRASSPATARSHLCDLQGKRLAWINESSRETRCAVEQIKQLTGGGAIVARQLYNREYTFRPTHLLLLLTSYRPEVDAADSIFWERLCLLTFNMHFVAKPECPNERQSDPQLRAVLEAEASGILAWLVRGALEWMRLGLAIPESVRKARKASPRSESSVQDFINQCCHLAVEVCIPANRLYKRYKRWATENKLTPISHKQFAREIKQAYDITCKRLAHGNAYTGICLRKEANQ